VTRRFATSTALVVFLAASGCRGGAGASASFATRVEAGDSVPVWVPAAATDLKLQSEETTGAFWLRFRLPATERPALEAGLNRIPDGQVATLTFRAPKGVDWWFRGLVQVVPARETTVIAADVFSGAGNAVPTRTFVAFDRNSETVYSWTPGR
jgi:hypothetical protein